MGSRGVGGRGCEEERQQPGVEKPNLAAWGIEGVSRAPDDGPWIRLAATTFNLTPLSNFSPHLVFKLVSEMKTQSAESVQYAGLAHALFFPAPLTLSFFLR